MLVILVLNFFSKNNKELSFKILETMEVSDGVLIDLVYSAPHSEDVYSYTFDGKDIKSSSEEYFPGINEYLPVSIFEVFGYKQEEVNRYGQVATYLNEGDYQILVLDGWRSAQNDIFEYTIAIKENSSLKKVKFIVEKDFTGYKVGRYKDKVYLVGSKGYVENDKFKDKIIVYEVDLNTEEVVSINIPVHLEHFVLPSISIKENWIIWSGIDDKNNNVLLQFDLEEKKIIQTNTGNYSIQKTVIDDFIYGFYLTESGLNYLKINSTGQLIEEMYIQLPFNKMDVTQLFIYNDIIYGVVNDIFYTSNTYIFRYKLNDKSIAGLIEIESHRISDIFLVDTFKRL